ncbi:MAG: hypothetical protein K1060chlam5_00544 [Candidatus Anoxychlamydiales bacterium]|nr:hypothetical protein [Candidatus Anoxychlamydiales bacterium]
MNYSQLIERRRYFTNLLNSRETKAEINYVSLQINTLAQKILSDNNISNFSFDPLSLSVLLLKQIIILRFNKRDIEIPKNPNSDSDIDSLLNYIIHKKSLERFLKHQQKKEFLEKLKNISLVSLFITTLSLLIFTFYNKRHQR